MEPAYKNFAFISYSHKDIKLAKWLQKKLESFPLPTEIHNDIDSGCRYLRPIFRDQSDLNAGILGDELRNHLKASKYLILICSKNSASSQWVSDEARAFVEMGRLDRIIPVIIPDGKIPETELFPIFLREYFAKNPDKELLGVNIGEVGREKAFIRVVSKMLDVSFDSLWKRHLRLKRFRYLMIMLALIVATGIIYIFAIPVKVDFRVDMEPSQLPSGETVKLVANGGEYVSSAAALEFDEIKLPGYRRFSEFSLSAESQFFNKVDTVVPVGFGLQKTVDIHLKRDDTFAVFQGHVFDSDLNPIENAKVSVAARECETNSEGEFSIRLPLAEQRLEQSISIEKSGYTPIERDDEIPGTELKFIMHRK